MTDELPHAAVRLVLDMYAAIDAGRARSVGGWFTEDAVFETSAMRAEGLSAIQGFLGAREDDRSRRTLHILNNVRGSRTGGAEVEITGLLFVYVPADGPSPWVLQHVAPARHVLRWAEDRWAIAVREPGRPAS